MQRAWESTVCRTCLLRTNAPKSWAPYAHTLRLDAKKRGGMLWVLYFHALGMPSSVENYPAIFSNLCMQRMFYMCTYHNQWGYLAIWLEHRLRKCITERFPKLGISTIYLAFPSYVETYEMVFTLRTRYFWKTHAPNPCHPIGRTWVWREIHLFSKYRINRHYIAHRTCLHRGCRKKYLFTRYAAMRIPIPCWCFRHGYRPHKYDNLMYYIPSARYGLRISIAYRKYLCPFLDFFRGPGGDIIPRNPLKTHFSGCIWVLHGLGNPNIPMVSKNIAPTRHSVQKEDPVKKGDFLQGFWASGIFRSFSFPRDSDTKWCTHTSGAM